MNISTLLAAIAIIGLGAMQYTLMVNAVRDLVRRPRVRGGNKVLWGLVILCLPFAGALMYGWMGPTSFLSRRQQEAQRPVRSGVNSVVTSTSGNVTPISSAPSVRRPGTSPRAIRPARTSRTGS